MCSWEGLLDLKNEKHVVSLSFLSGQGSAPPRSCYYLILECLPTGDRLQLLSLGPIYLLPQLHALSPYLSLCISSI